MFVIVGVGCEGIDHIYWAGEDAEQAKAVVLDLRGKGDAAKKREETNPPAEPAEDAPDEEWEAYWAHQDALYDLVADRICIQHSHAGELDFHCCCKDLGVPPRQGCLY